MLLLIEDDAALGELITDYLQGFQLPVTHALTARAGLQQIRHPAIKLVILDLMLPDMDGLEVCRLIRQQSRIPILMLTARGDAMDRVLGLEMGADDYLPKPFEPRELLARIRAILRRSELGQESASSLQFGNLRIQADTRSVWLAGQSLTLTAYQFDLLYYMARHPGQVLSREQLLQALPGDDSDNLDRAIDVHISRLRSLIETNPRQPQRIVTIRNAGYQFQPLDAPG